MLLSCAAGVPFVYFMCPETTGKSLEEIDLIFARDIGTERTLALNHAVSEREHDLDEDKKQTVTHAEIA